MITPNSTIKFLNIPFSLSQNNVLNFGSLSLQQNYMIGKTVFTISGCLYVREGEKEFLKVEKGIDSLYQCNYVMFQNPNYSDKWFYAFIESMEYVSPKVTRLSLKMDVYQTFMFDFTLKESFIERKSFVTDSYNTLADTPSTGELKTVYEMYQNLEGVYIAIFNSDFTMDNASTSTSIDKSVKIGNYNMPVLMYQTLLGSDMSKLIQEVSNKGRADRIQACYYAPFSPNALLDKVSVYQMSVGDLNLGWMFIPMVSNIDISSLSKYINVDLTSHYSPAYLKELCYPYAKLEVCDEVTGKTIELDLSKFDNPLSPNFKMTSTITDKPEYKIIPVNYNGEAYSIQNALVINPATELPIFSNSYAKYMKDNKVANNIQMAKAVIGGVGSIANGDIGGAIGSITNVMSVMNQERVSQTQPNQCSGISGDAENYLNLTPHIIFRLKVMDSIHMNMAHSFWKMFGYPVRSLDTFVNNSNRYNYIKMVNSNIVADTIPSEYQRELEGIFDRGVTIWNNNYLDY